MKQTDTIEKWAGRVPVLFLLAAMAALFLGFPYAGLNADATTFGLMGEDIGRYGYLPTLTYGQNYLFSLTPYFYAFWKVVLPSGTSAAFLLSLAGSLLSLFGLWMIFESFRLVQKSRGGAAVLPLLCFVLLVGADTVYVSDLMENSSIELSLLTLGAMMLAGARLERGNPEDNAGAVSPVEKTGTGVNPRNQIWWCILGASLGYALYSRPQVVLYGAPLAAILLIRCVRRGEGRHAMRAPIVWSVAGLAVGLLPLLLHDILRGPNWPFLHHVPSHLGNLHKIAHSMQTEFGVILPVVFDMGSDSPIRNVVMVLWIVVTTGCYAWVLHRRSNRLSALDHAWVIGSLSIILVMVLIPNLSFSGMQRRYCLHALLTMVWLFCRLVPAPGWRNIAAGGLCLAITALSLPHWKDNLATIRNRERQMREVREKLVPELAAHDALILANYWDAYLLAFLSEGRLRVEAAPWELVRTYGLFTRADFGKRNLWLIPVGYGHMTGDRLKSEVSPDIMAGMKDVGVTNRFLGRDCDLWEFPDPLMAVRLMERHKPAYFRTPYPPGSGPLSPQTSPASAAFDDSKGSS